jgi:hypothetical protein
MQKPYFEIRFAVPKPRHLTGCFMTGRLFPARDSGLRHRVSASGV